MCKRSPYKGPQGHKGHAKSQSQYSVIHSHPFTDSRLHAEHPPQRHILENGWGLGANLKAPIPSDYCECEWETDRERPRQPAGSSRLPVFRPAPSPPTSTQMDTDPLETWRPAATPSQGPPLCPPFSSQPLLGLPLKEEGITARSTLL